MELLQKGNEWVKIDLHLHTKTDKQFRYCGNSFEEDYISALIKYDIKIAAITNHNQFNYDEFINLHNLAETKGIWLLPGVELSVSDGKKGIHLLIIFDDNEIKLKNFIEDFLTIVFEGTDRADKNNDPLLCRLDLLETLDKLENFNRSFFTILAHVDNDKGFFKSIANNRVKSFIGENIFRKNILAFQGINNSSSSMFEACAKEIKGNYPESCIPAFILCSDPKSIDEIGTKYTYIKLGEFNFNSLKFAFMNHELRIRKDLEQKIYPSINNIKIETGKFIESADIKFNSDLNTLIGVRGSGKSTIIELIRWCLGKHPQEDNRYKEDIIKNALGNGGKVILEIIGRNGYKYFIEKISGDNNEKVYDENNELSPDLRGDNIFDIMYYGQKDLSKFAQDSGKITLIDDFIKQDLSQYDNKEQLILEDIEKFVKELKSIEKHNLNIESFKSEIAEKNEQKRMYKDRNVDKLLKEQTDFERDKIKFEQLLSSIEEIVEKFHVLKSGIDEKFDTIKTTEFFRLPSSIKTHMEDLRINILKKIEQIIISIDEAKKSINIDIELFNKEFECVKEKLREIKSNFDYQNIDINFYIALERDIEKLNIKVKTLEDITEKKQSIEKHISTKIDELTKIRHSKFIKRREKAGIIQEKIDFIKLSVEYRQDKEGFLLFLTELLKGKSIRKEKINRLINEFNNGYYLFTAIIERDKKASELLTETELLNMTERLKEYMFNIITYQPEDKLLITYQVGSSFKEIEKLSIGQRAAGLLAIILSQGDKTIIIEG